MGIIENCSLAIAKGDFHKGGMVKSRVSMKLHLLRKENALKMPKYMKIKTYNLVF